MRSVRSAQIVFPCIFIFSTCCVYFLRQRDVYKEKTKQSVVDNNIYYRDHNGYIYPREYFPYLPIGRSPLFDNRSLIGRHSDTVLSRCYHSNGNHPDNVKSEYKFIEPFDYLKDYKNPCWYEQEQFNKTLRCLPYYYFIGTPKAGSTDLFWRLQMHQDVASISAKEHRWFDTSRFKDKDKQSIDFYIHQFDRAARFIQKSTRSTGFHHKIVGDGSPSYLFNNVHWLALPGNEWCLEPRVLALSYIHHLLPSAKLILIVRNPVDRLYSDYLFNSKRSGAKKTPEEFHDWAKTTIQVYLKCFKEQPFRYCLYSKKIKYLSRIHSFSASIYSRLILDVLKMFPRNQLLVVHMENYSDNMEEHLKEVFAFLGLDPLSESQMKAITQIKQYNEGKHYQQSGPMLPATRRMIYEFYKPFNEELAQILKDDKYLWLEK